MYMYESIYRLGGMKVWVITKSRMSLGWGVWVVWGGGGIFIRVYIGVGGMKVCMIAKLCLSESKREFLYTLY